MENIIKEVQGSGLFDSDWYLKQYPDVRKYNLSPLEHYLEYGWKLGRNPSVFFDTEHYIKNNRDIDSSEVNPLLHYIRYGKKEDRGTKKKRSLPDNSPLKYELAALNQDYAKKIKKNELGYLLDYATLLRKSGCLESYAGIVRYLTLHYDEFIERLQKILDTHIRNVVLLTDDNQLLEYLTSKKIDLLLTLNLPKSKIYSLLELPHQRIEYQEIDKNSIFDLQNNDRIVDMLVENPSALKNNKELNALLANVYARTRNFALYSKTVEYYLSQENCETSFNLRYFSDNVLSKVETKAINEKWTDYGKISVIMSAYNSENTIEYALKSLLEQTYKNMEILVCDDNSTDRTLEIANEIAQQDKRIKIFRSHNNQGTYNIRNHMIERASGKYITFQDSDDYALPTRLQRQIEKLNQQNATLCFARWIRVMPDGQFVFFIDGILKRFSVISAMASSKFLKSIAKFRQSLVAADTEFYEFCKNTLAPDQIVHVESPLILGLWGSGSLTKKENLNAENTGYVAPRRLAYSEISGKQRLLGDGIITDELVDSKLKEINIFMHKSKIKEY